MVKHCNDVRFAVPEDAEALMRIIHDSWQEEFTFHPFSPQKVALSIAHATSRNGQFMGVVGPVGGPLRAYNYMVLDAIWFSEEPQVTCLATYVHPKCRASTYGRQLLNWARQASDELGMKLLTGVVSDEKTEAKCKMWGRHFREVGKFYLHEPGEGTR